MSGVKFNIPFFLTMSRLVFLPVLFWLMFAGHTWWFFALYISLGFTDWLDGYFARKLNQVTEHGHLLDTAADLPFYISSAYFINYLFPHVIANNLLAVQAFFTALGLTILTSLVMFRKLHLLHTNILRLCATLVFFVTVTSFFFDTTWFARLVLWLFFIGLAEEVTIFLHYGEVDPDTRTILHLMKEKPAA